MLNHPWFRGVASAIAPHAAAPDDLRAAPRHALLLDFDADRLARIEDAAALAIARWRLPSIYISASRSRGGFHAMSLCGRPRAEIAAISKFMRADPNHRRQLNRVGFSVLRTGPKIGPRGGILQPAPHVICVVTSPYPVECLEDWLVDVEYSSEAR